jgi:Protein of unknown function (DUF3096)
MLRQPPTALNTPMGNTMNMTIVTIGPIVSLIAGVLILVVPRLLNYIVAIYLILIGLIELFGHHALHVT